MKRNIALFGTSALLDDFMAAIHTFVPRGQIRGTVHPATFPSGADTGVDAIVQWTLGRYDLQFDVEIKLDAAASRALTPISDYSDERIPVVIARYLSPVDRRRIMSGGWSYWDSTGNVLIQHAEPLIRIERDGAQRSPEPAERDDRLVSLKGRGAARVVEYLLTNGSTTGPRDLARNTLDGVGVATASRVLTLLREENFFEPTGGGATTVRDRTALARRLVEDYSFVRSNRAKRYFSPMGREGALMALRSKGAEIAATGLQGATEFLADNNMRASLPTSDLWLYAKDRREVERVAQLEPDSRNGNIWVADAQWMFTTSDYFMAPAGTRAYPWRIAFDLLSYTGRHTQAGEDLIQRAGEDLLSQLVSNGR
ncbi:hypothetical protein [Demequina aurantiaca]|uniref:hypothetical protein n=1 Tax=Demequina aurantiaca TaxID=676200 RepID=UPI003D34D7E7